MGNHMLRGVLATLILFCCAWGADARADRSRCEDLLAPQAVTTQWVDQMRSRSAAQDPQTIRLRDAAQRVGFSTIALDRDISRNHNDSYTVELDRGAITDQESSGRCWIFAALNMIRSTMIAEGRVPRDFEFSENYLHFFNMLEKANKYLETASGKVYESAGDDTLASLREELAVTLGDGGFYEYFMQLVTKYGLVPKQAMPETISSEHTATLIAELTRHLANVANRILVEGRSWKRAHPKKASTGYAKLVGEIREQGMREVWDILVTHLGLPPKDFDFRGNGPGSVASSGAVKRKAVVVKFTPSEFAREFVAFDPADYVVVTSFPTQKMNTVFNVQGSAIGPSGPGEPSFDRKYLNVTPARMEELTVEALDAGQPVWFAADMGRDIDFSTGIMHPDLFQRDEVYGFVPAGRTPPMTRRQQYAFKIGGANHAMVFVGYDRPDPKGAVIKFKVENSWGADTGDAGIYHMYREWFAQNVYHVVIHKRLLGKAETKLWAGPATVIQEEDED